MNVKTIKLESGSHEPSEGKGCVMEIVSMLAGEKWTDTPDCACPVLTSFAIATNDWMDDDERQLLWPFTTRLVGSRGGPTTTRDRALRMADWACREIVPLAMEAEGHKAEADKARSLNPIVGMESALMARDALQSYATHAATNAATYAAYAANYATDAAHAAHAANAAHAATAANAAARYPADRSTLIQMRISLLDELCPPAPLPDDALVCDLEARLEVAHV